MTLSEYLASQPRGALTGLAEKLGIHHAELIRYRDGAYVPRADLALRIAEVTAGAVPVESWAREGEPDPAPEPAGGDCEAGEAV